MKAWLAWPCLALISSLALVGCGSSSTAATISITPTSATVLLNTSIQFIPSETGSSNAIQWSVNGIANGNATVGTISAAGLYTAPGTVPASATGVAVPIIFCTPNSSVPNSGSTGAVCELQAGFNLTNFVAGDTITIANNSQAGWDGSFIIQFAAPLSNGNFGVQIANPAGPPPTGTGGTATAVPNLTISAQVESTSAVATATVTLDSGVRVAFSETTFTIGTNEEFLFTPFISVSGSSNPAVTWSVSSGIGTIDPNSGLYIAPSTTGTATITATSVVDPSQSASATVSIVTAADPTLTSLNPPTGALGAAFQEVYLSGTNFISTTLVFVNRTPLPSNALFAVSPSTLLVVVPDSVLSTLPTPPATNVTLTFTVARQNGAQQVCSPSPCTLGLSPVRPAVVAATPDSIQPAGGNFNVVLDGGYFGTTNTTLGFAGNPAVNLQFNGTSVLSPSFNSDRQLSFTLSSSQVNSPGLYPITVANNVTCTTVGPGCGSGSPNGGMAAVNMAVQPNKSSFPPSPIGTPIHVGTKPTSVAINTATGIAVVANQNSNDITLVNLNLSPPAASGFICTGTVGATLTPTETSTCPASAPVGVAVDNIRNLALVANSNAPNPTLAVVNLTTLQVTALLTFPSAETTVGTPVPLAPQAIGINPVSGRALVAFTVTVSGSQGGSSAGAILDMNQLQNTIGAVTLPAAVVGAVNLNNGLFPHIAVSPKLNWALATPGGAGSLSIVDLGRQSTNQLSSISCSPGASGAPTVVAANTTATVGLQVGEPVLVSGVSPSAFNGIFSVTAVSNTAFQYFSQAPCPSSATSGSGGMASYSFPVATLATNFNVRGVSINDETQKALLVDPTPTVPAFVFNILDQSSVAIPQSQLPSSLNNVAAAMDPLMNIGLVVNQGVSGQGQVFVVDPVAPQVLSPTSPPIPFTTGTAPVVDVAIDPGTGTAVFVSQGDNTVTLFSLPALRSAPQIAQASFTPAGGASSSHVTLNSSLGSAATAQNQTVTLVGHFSAGAVPRLDGDPSPFSGVSVSANARVMTATLSGAILASNGPRLYSLDV